MTEQTQREEHTPGPWDVHNYDDCPDHPWITARCNFDKNASGKGYWYLSVSGPISQADARLIAAAPDLLEALRYADAEFERIGLPEDCSPRLEVRAAIAKAEGRE